VDDRGSDIQVPSSKEEAFKKASDVIASCQTREHAQTACRYADRCVAVHGEGLEADHLRLELADLDKRFPPDGKEKS